MHFSDATKPLHGIFSYKVYHKTKGLVGEYEDQNLIVHNSRDIMAYLLGGDTAEKSVTRISIGNSTTAASPDDTQISGCETTALLNGDTRDINGDIIAFTKEIDGHSYPESGKVTFSWSVGYTEAQDLVITEFGLLCEDGTMFAHKVRGQIVKDSDLLLEGSWSIIF